MKDEELCVVPLRVGVRVFPPALTLVYRKGGGKERYRVMPIRCLNKFGAVDATLKDLQQRHMDYLTKVPEVRLEKLLRMLQETQRGGTLDEVIKTIGQEYNVDPLQDLNKLDDQQLAKKKKVMDGSFERNRLRPGDPGYEYDKQVEFGTGEQVGSGWDSPDEDDDFWN